MTELLTSAQMRAIEQAAIAAGQVTGLELMERAGAGVVEAVLDEWPGLAEGPRKAVVLCGPGNNGGDGFVIARLLHGRDWTVDVYVLGDPDRLPPDALANFLRWTALGAVHPFPQNRPDPWGADLIVDAGFGTGLSRPLDEALMAAFLGCLPEGDLKAAGDPPHVIAVDIPTGLSADTGALCPAAVSADLTVTFHSPKLGHYLDRGPEFCGKLKIVDIGIDRNRANETGHNRVGVDPLPHVGLIDRVHPGLLGKWTIASAHKYSHGHALIMTGGAGRTGAARLAARGALRIGAGLVTLGVPGSAQMECATQVTAVMLRRVDDAGALAQVLQDSRFNALCLGPGLGLDRARDLVPAALRAGHQPGVVLDADALTAFQDEPDALFAQLHTRCVLTPHGGEFARLFPDLAARLVAPSNSGPAYSKVDATRDAAARAGCVVLFKGPDTVIAAPDGRAFVHAAVYDRCAPWLATAGAGDVLAGFITGLMARGCDPVQAATLAAWLHVDCARAFGPGLIAEDLPETLPQVLRALGA